MRILAHLNSILTALVVQGLTLVLLNCLLLFFINSKMLFLTQFPASNNEKYLSKNKLFQY